MWLIDAGVSYTQSYEYEYRGKGIYNFPQLPANSVELNAITTHSSATRYANEHQ